jgi:hypothetical protein
MQCAIGLLVFGWLAERIDGLDGPRAVGRWPASSGRERRLWWKLLI